MQRPETEAIRTQIELKQSESKSSPQKQNVRLKILDLGSRGIILSM